MCLAFVVISEKLDTLQNCGINRIMQNHQPKSPNRKSFVTESLNPLQAEMLHILLTPLSKKAEVESQYGTLQFQGTSKEPYKQVLKCGGGLSLTFHVILIYSWCYLPLYILLILYYIIVCIFGHSYHLTNS